MYENFFYQDKGLFLQSLHPAAILAYLCILLVLALLFSNPVYLVGLLLVLVLNISAAQGGEVWGIYLKIGLGFALPIIIINALLARGGETIIWAGPNIPVLGRLTISLEAICYSAAMSVRLFIVISIFCLYNLVVHPDRVLALLSRFASKTALILSLATRLFPSMVRQMANIQEAMMIRGVDFQTGNLKQKLKSHAVLINILLLSSLEDSLEIAEAMHARAFGSGPRSSYQRHVWRPRDSFCLGGAILAFGLAVCAQITGYSTFEFYPRLGCLLKNTMAVFNLVFIVVFLSVPAVLSWGWRRCPYFNAKI
ncbi:energy-coupling factor transporter transmembrane component T [Moorella sulfitireducens]|uniref:energy-coupling factor transporter transmembrane component T n=1 Tax=Neomoorella sulfitireducens TaxID=2972948 RepID=UPI0021AC98A5|nr:energy-coupling factor transporter transmembrane component T [Moorella sulfitireducens]